MIPTKSGPPPKPGHADTLQPDSERKQDQDEQLANQSAELGKEVGAAELKDNSEEIPPQKDMLREPDGDAGARPATSPDQDSARDTAVEDGDSEWEPKPPKVLMENPNDTPLELLAQIQLYATTESVGCDHLWSRTLTSCSPGNLVIPSSLQFCKGHWGIYVLSTSSPGMANVSGMRLSTSHTRRHVPRIIRRGKAY